MMKVVFDGEADDVQAALAYLKDLGVGVDVVQGGT